MGYTVGSYLAKRFEQMGIEHNFIVPGDLNLVLLDELLKNKNLEQVGCCNELNAAYAAEGYARAKGASALVVTFNVGAFSAINGVAGAYAERLPVIFVSGSFNTNDPVAGHIPHHSLGIRDLNYQREMISKVTCDAVQIIHEKDAPYLIDRVIINALKHRLPGYIEIPSNIANAPCPDPVPFETLFKPPISDPKILQAAVNTAAMAINNADRPVILAGPNLRAYGAIDAFRELAEALGCAVAVQPSAKSFFPENHPQFIGIYWGSVSSPGCEELVDWSDMIIAAGAVYTDYTTVGWTAMPPDEKTVNIEPNRVRIPGYDYNGLKLADFLSDLAKKVSENDASLTSFNRTRREQEPIKPADPEGHLTRMEMIRQIQDLLSPKTTLFVESGDSWFNGMFMELPENAKFEIEMQWGSIGWSVPSTFGYALAVEPDQQVLSLIGDGSFQFTAQEVANMIRYELDNVILFVVNNHGYVVESEIHEGPYNYFKNWDYAGLVEVLNADDGNGLGLTASTGSELADAIEKAKAHKGGSVLIECQIGHEDCSRELLEWGTKVGAANQRPPMH
ncbi:alpha-keto acid decarboxylase family protein [Methanobacterium sp.]|uniref:alpha-keto acid decarboxylase family protein n=1 Tax=Methanobacterium sp. TaxID=2164 RepID=UPI003C76AB84